MSYLNQNRRSTFKKLLLSTVVMSSVACSSLEVFGTPPGDENENPNSGGGIKIQQAKQQELSDNADMYYYGRGVLGNWHNACDLYKKLDEHHNDARAQYMLGEIHRIGVEDFDGTKAIPYYKKAANQGYKDALKTLEELAFQNNDVEAQNSLGIFYLEGKKLSQNLKKAFKLFTLSADQGHLDSINRLAWMHFLGDACPNDPQKAIILWYRAAEKGYRAALRQLADMYYEGRGVDKNWHKALDLYKRLDKHHNDARAQYMLGEIHRIGVEDFDGTKALPYYWKAANQMYKEALIQLADMYYQENWHQALDLYKRLDEHHNDVRAQYMLGEIHRLGVEDFDGTEAIPYYRKSANQGNKEAQSQLDNLFFLQKKGVKGNWHAAFESYTDLSKEDLRQRAAQYYHGDGVDKNLHTAFVIYKGLDSRHNDAQAQYMLGEIHRLGGKAFDGTKATPYYWKAANQKFRPAIEKLTVNFPEAPFVQKTKTLDAHDDFYAGLSIDGGGIRGAIPTIMLQKFEQEAQHYKPNVRIHQMFDYIGGTSAGGILALGLTAPKSKGSTEPLKTMDQLVDMCSEESSVIFQRSIGGKIPFHDWFAPKFTSQGLEKQLQRYFDDLSLIDSLTPVVVTAVHHARSPFEPFLFDTFRARQHIDHDFRMRDVGRATSAAQTYFPEAKIWNLSNKQSYKFSDGGVWANNPARIVYDKIVQNFDHVTSKNVVILSLGTGVAKPVYSAPKTQGVRGWGTSLYGKNPLLFGIMDLISAGVDLSLRETLGSNYIRLQPKILDKRGNLKDADMADTSSVLFEQYEDIASRLFRLYTAYDEDNFIRTLIEKRDQRKDPI